MDFESYCFSVTWKHLLSLQLCWLHAEHRTWTCTDEVTLPPHCHPSESKLDFHLYKHLNLLSTHLAPLQPRRDKFCVLHRAWDILDTSGETCKLSNTYTCIYSDSCLIIAVADHISDIWATSWQNQQNGMCAQRWLRSAWSESSLCAQWVAKDPNFLHADSEDSDQTGRMPRLVRVFTGRTCHFVGFVMRRLISFNKKKENVSKLIHDVLTYRDKIWNPKGYIFEKF